MTANKRLGELVLELSNASQLDKWPYEIRSLTKEKIMEAVADRYWQKFRSSLKGLPTVRKLAELKGYWDYAQGSMVDATEKEMIEIQVINYLNALKRGGQLNDKLEVVK